MNQYIIKLKRIFASKYFFKILFLFSLIYLFLIVNIMPYKSIYNNYDNEFIGKVYKYKLNNNKLTIYLKSKENLLINYKVKNNLNIEYGSIIKVKGQLVKPDNNTVPNIFNYNKYLKSKKIFNIVNAEDIIIIKQNQSIIYDIKNKLINRINKINKSSAYLFSFILGEKDKIPKEVMTSYRECGISHLFSVSGMHITLFTGIIYYFLKKINYNNHLNFLLVLLFLIFYEILLGYTVSVTRTILMFSLFKINKLFKFNIKKIDIMLIIFTIFIFNNAYIIYDISFWLSYLISFYLILLEKKIKKRKYKNIYLSYISFLVSMPLIIYNNYQINLISIIFNIIAIPYVSIIIFPLSILTLIFPSLDNILFIFIKLLEIASLYINKIQIFKINLAKGNIYLIIIYYIIITIALYNKKYLLLLLTILIIHKNYKYFNNQIKISFIDILQGDSALITYKDKSILIDTGGNKLYENLIDERIILYLKSQGIEKINYLIITHGDYDHMGESINLINNFKVDKVIFNCGLFNDLEKELIINLNKKKIPYYSCIKQLNIENYQFNFLNNNIYNNENDNSSVIYTKINNYKFLFMGDASTFVEEDLLKKYNLIDIDILKVGHHGSNTSSSRKFIDSINPKYSVISVGKNNIYGHPNKEVLENLKNSKIYRTDLNGSIIFNIKNNKLKIKIYSP